MDPRLLLVILAALAVALVIIGLARIPDAPGDPLGPYRTTDPTGWASTRCAGRRHSDLIGRPYPWPPEWRPRSETEYRMAVEAGWHAPDDWWPGYRDDDALSAAGLLDDLELTGRGGND